MDKIEIYQNEDGGLVLPVAINAETVWLSQAQMILLFGRDKSVISRHINNVFKEGELERGAVVAKYATTAEDGKTYQVEHYNLDVIISVGYRVKSQQGVRFRQWATTRLKDYLIKGYSINQQRFDKNAKELEQALTLIDKAIKSPELNPDTSKGLAEIVSRYTQTFLWLQRYDEGLLEDPSGQTGGQLVPHDVAMQSLLQLKQQLMDRGEATPLFAQPRGNGLASLLGNLAQSAFGELAYPTIESKAAHLLYFVVKNHPFVDGNKRSGAFLFVDFLYRNHHLYQENGEAVINDTGLAALTLLVAESAPEQKETIIRLIMNMLARE
ncbi:virulence protein RhuM/Fic/DOC family protein [Marinomonas sp. THO17]|uniref:virulence protein RhuM/Fic/DOC family protein n=1 Tax=Marinomonas sp. THO17 TaxID=3149048 RepID=UPI00336BC56C